MFLSLTPSQEAVSIISSKLEDEEYEELVRKCVHALIVLGQDRTPIKRLELNKIVFSNVNYRVAGAIVQVANKELDHLFGMRLYELSDKLRFILVNSEPTFATAIKYSDPMCEWLAILYLILIDIFSSPENRLPFEDIQKSLQPLDISEASLKNHLDTFTKKFYLQSEKRQDNVFYSWGERSMAEVEPESFFNRFLEMAGGNPDTEWPEQRARIEKLKSIR